MKILFHINHPAQYHLFKNIIGDLKKENHEVLIIARNKDVLTQLLHNDGVDFINTTHRTDRESNLFSLLINFTLQYRKVKKICKDFKPDLMLGTSFTLPWISKKLRIPFLNFVEDDAQVIPLYSKLSFPFSTHIITPQICQLGRWEKKKIGYNGYHELAFLRPDQFEPSNKIASKYVNTDDKIFLLRFTAFNAHHDYGKRGIDIKTAKKTIHLLKPYGRVLISSEKPLDAALDEYRLSINPNDIHHVMAHCQLIIGDSQSMAMEAACLGIPSIRLNDYAGRISVLEELEKKYELTYGYGIKNKVEFYSHIKKIAEDPDGLKLFNDRKNKMLDDKIDVNSFLYWLVSQYPSSIETAKDEALINSKFKGNNESVKYYELKKGKNQQSIMLLAFYFVILLLLYIIPLSEGWRLNRYHFSGFRLDHIIHLLIFLPTTYMISPFFLRQTQFRRLKIVLLALVIATLYEVTHIFVAYRAFTLEDLLSNLMGVLIGAIPIMFIYRKF